MKVILNTKGLHIHFYTGMVAIHKRREGDIGCNKQNEFQGGGNFHK
jgi:hypothetical protein